MCHSNNVHGEIIKLTILFVVSIFKCICLCILLSTGINIDCIFSIRIKLLKWFVCIILPKIEHLKWKLKHIYYEVPSWIAIDIGIATKKTFDIFSICSIGSIYSTNFYNGNQICFANNQVNIHEIPTKKFSKCDVWTDPKLKAYFWNNRKKVLIFDFKLIKIQSI